MALFGMHYDKPGPGVAKNEAPESAPVHFLKLYGRKFWKLIQINLIYFGCCIIFWLPCIFTVAADGFESWVFYLSTLPIILTGPLTAGFTLVLRNFAREKPTFLWGDFKDAVRNNWKQAFPAAAITVCGSCVLLFLFYFYSATLQTHPLFFIPLVIVSICCLLFIFMHYYVFVIMTTFNMPLKNIYRNAMMFAFLGVGQNFLITIFSAVILFVTCVWIPILMVLLPFITIGTIGFLVNFAVWPVIQKYMIDTHPEILPKEEIVRPIFSDNVKKK